MGGTEGFAQNLGVRFQLLNILLVNRMPNCRQQSIFLHRDKSARSRGQSLWLCLILFEPAISRPIPLLTGQVCELQVYSHKSRQSCHQHWTPRFFHCYFMRKQFDSLASLSFQMRTFEFLLYNQTLSSLSSHSSSCQKISHIQRQRLRSSFSQFGVQSRESSR